MFWECRISLDFLIGIFYFSDFGTVNVYHIPGQITRILASHILALPDRAIGARALLGVVATGIRKVRRALIDRCRAQGYRRILAVLTPEQLSDWNIDNGLLFLCDCDFNRRFRIIVEP
jgi:hypothetical protein